MLAAAYAEADRFDEAVKTANEALGLFTNPNATGLVDQIRSRRDLYLSKQKFRNTLRTVK